MSQLSCITRGALFAVVALIGACASRAVPPDYPKNAPASINAQAAKPAMVTQSLQDDTASNHAEPGGNAQVNAHPLQNAASPASEHEGHHDHH